MEEGTAHGYKDTLQDRAESPFECAMHEEVRAKVEAELAQVNEPYRTTVILRDIEDLSYEEIAEVTGASLGTVKSRLMRGRQALKKRLEQYVKQHGAELGISAGAEKKKAAPERARDAHAVEVKP
jgi:RNA polymerase sigma-70 factor (ECF subfamily)